MQTEELRSLQAPLKERYRLDTDASEEQRSTLIRLTERYCVVYQTLRRPADMQVLVTTNA